MPPLLLLVCEFASSQPLWRQSANCVKRIIPHPFIDGAVRGVTYVPAERLEEWGDRLIAGMSLLVGTGHDLGAVGIEMVAQRAHLGMRRGEVRGGMEFSRSHAAEDAGRNGAAPDCGA